MVLFVVCACFLAIRDATGVVAIYIPYEEYWVDDVRFYLLDTLPEYLVLIIMVWPAMMARMGQTGRRQIKAKIKAKATATMKAKMVAVAGTQAKVTANGALTLRLQCWTVLLTCLGLAGLQAMVTWSWLCQPMILCTSSCFC